MSEEQRGDELMAEGEKCLRRMSIWNLVEPSTKKFEDAKEKFVKASALFKMVKSWDKAGRAFERCAEMADGLDIPHEASQFQMDAADMYSRVDKKKATKLFKSVANKNCEMGRFQKAAQMLDAAGALLEEDDLGEAVECYAKAADYYFSDRANSKGNKSLEKVAFLSADLGNFGDSAKVFEKLGYDSLESQLLKFGSKKHFMHAIFCYLAKGDVVAAKVALGRYVLADLSLKGSRELILCEALCETYENLDSEGFSEALASFDRIMPLDRWQTSTLLRVKKAIDEAGNAKPDLS